MNLADNDGGVSLGYRHFSGGLVVGLGCFSSGIGMSRFLDMYMTSHVSGNNNYTPITNESAALMGNNMLAKSELAVSWKLCFSMFFLEAIGLYSLIVALFLTKS